ncbi:sulfurtransferase TusA family protein [Oleisolibacter albus]|uniref:sulfurtransferase TusA family protein n=1 Tax=Oleisolibacter albus TaxID=2171757 RepID=UPI000DF29F29|nr:sulfurtransferase TusA family protein [Oleisolibacter albus]
MEPDYFLDITSLVCPMTFVRTKLAVERLSAGQVLEVRMNSGEPLVNVPRTLTEHGHVVLSLSPENAARPDGIHRMMVRRS